MQSVLYKGTDLINLQMPDLITACRYESIPRDSPRKWRFIVFCGNENDNCAQSLCVDSM